MQAIASKGELTAPVALKAVASDWPFYGKLDLTDGRKAGAPPEGTVWIAQGTAARLGIKSGDSFRIGGQTVTAGGVIKTDPEPLGDGFAMGDPAIVTRDQTQQVGLTGPGRVDRRRGRDRKNR